MQHPAIRFGVSLYLRRRRRQAARLVAATTADPERYQREALRRILAMNAGTGYGREFGFASIDTVGAFQARVPINTYEDLRPYVDRVADGSDPHALTRDDVEMFTNTSGTTSRPKLIPVTASGRAAERRVKDAWLAHLHADHPEVLNGTPFYLFNRAEEYRTPAGLWVGSNGGLMYKNTPRLLQSVQAVPYEVCEIDDYHSRYYVILRHLLAVQLSMMVCINPSSILLLAELADQHAEALIRDIYTGTLRDGLELTREQYAFFRARLRPDRERARELARMAARDGSLRPSRYWPGMAALASWKGPGVAAFIEKFRGWYGDTPHRDVGYGSSEFRTGLVLSDAGSPNIPLPDNYFYEFIPEDDRAPYLALARPPLGLHELDVGRRYLIVQTGPHGLYRYNIEDIVEVNGFHGRTPTIHFVQKARMVTSITGEKLYESHVIEAMDRVAARRPHLKPSFYVLYADMAAANYKLCVEHDRELDREELEELLAAFEAALGEVNIEYPYKRASLRIKDPEIFALPRGASVRLIQHIGQRSVQDNQAKVPRLSRAVDEHFRLFDLDPGTGVPA